MKKNIIILTYGLSGSSVLTGLLVRGGYWPGAKTYVKPDYDTFENVRLIELNKQLFAAAKFSGNYENSYSPEALRAITDLRSTLDPAPFRQFIAECDQHRPWIWKDPRLWLTMRYWADLLDLSGIDFVLLTRTPMQSWISYNLRRQVQSYGYAQRYCRQIETAIQRFLDERGLKRHEILFDDLIVKPEETLERLNAFLGTGLTAEDLQAVYNQPLRRAPRSSLDFLKAALIYARNYGERQR
jgi:hypothetical protein